MMRVSQRYLIDIVTTAETPISSGELLASELTAAAVMFILGFSDFWSRGQICFVTLTMLIGIPFLKIKARPVIDVHDVVISQK